MAGSIPVEVSQYPDDFQTLVKHFPSGTTSDNTGPLFYCERDTVIDAAFASSEDADSDLTFTIKHAPSETVVGSATAITDAMAVTVADKIVTGVINTDTNFVPAGSIVHVVVGGAADGTAESSMVQVRYRTRIA